MSPGFAVFILMNNYFHDVATAMLPACAVALWIILRQFRNSRDPAVIRYFGRLSNGIRQVVRFSIAWIIIGGIPRALTFSSFEWPNAVEKHHEAGLIAKYIIAAVMTAAGGYVWLRLSKMAREIRQ